MKCYHRTSAENAKRILVEGFRDSTDSYMTDREFTGVWFSAGATLSIQEVLLAMLFLSSTSQRRVSAEFEWVEEGKAYREALIPAARINALGKPNVIANE